MSYEIIYDRQFIKAEKEGKPVFFPMLYMGSSNCYEVGRNGRNGRRERGWHNSTYQLGKKRYGTLEEMMQNVEKEREEMIERCNKSFEQYKEEWCKYSDERWGSHAGISFGGGCKATFGQYKGLFVTGCKKALTVEELAQFRVSVNIHTYIYSDENRAKFKLAGKEEINFTPQTSKELIEKIDEFEEYLKDTPYVSLYVTIDADEYIMKRIRREKFPKTKHPKELKTVDKFYVVKDTSTGNYVLKASRGGYKYSYNGRSYCKRFFKETDAKKLAKRMNEKMLRTFVVEEVNETAQIYA
jgi:hypothetical protein